MNDDFPTIELNDGWAWAMINNLVCNTYSQNTPRFPRSMLGVGWANNSPENDPEFTIWLELYEFRKLLKPCCGPGSDLPLRTETFPCIVTKHSILGATDGGTSMERSWGSGCHPTYCQTVTPWLPPRCKERWQKTNSDFLISPSLSVVPSLSLSLCGFLKFISLSVPLAKQCVSYCSTPVNKVWTKITSHLLNRYSDWYERQVQQKQLPISCWRIVNIFWPRMTSLFRQNLLSLGPLPNPTPRSSSMSVVFLLYWTNWFFSQDAQYDAQYFLSVVTAGINTVDRLPLSVHLVCSCGPMLWLAFMSFFMFWGTSFWLRYGVQYLSIQQCLITLKIVYFWMYLSTKSPF